MANLLEQFDAIGKVLVQNTLPELKKVAEDLSESFKTASKKLNDFEDGLTRLHTAYAKLTNKADALTDSLSSTKDVSTIIQSFGSEIKHARNHLAVFGPVISDYNKKTRQYISSLPPVQKFLEKKFVASTLKAREEFRGMASEIKADLKDHIPGAIALLKDHTPGAIDLFFTSLRLIKRDFKEAFPTFFPEKSSRGIADSAAVKKITGVFKGAFKGISAAKEFGGTAINSTPVRGAMRFFKSLREASQNYRAQNPKDPQNSFAAQLKRRATRVGSALKRMGSTVISNLGNFMKGAASKVVSGFSGVVSGFKGMVGLIEGSLDEVNDINKKAADARMSVEDYQFFSQAAIEAGESPESVSAGLRNFDMQAQKALEGGGEDSRFTQAFKQYGIAVKGENGELRSSTDLLGDAAKVVSNLEAKGQSPAAFLDTLFNLKHNPGQDNSTAILAALKKGGGDLPTALAAFKKNEFFLSEEEVEKGKKFKKLWDSTSKTLGVIGNKIAIALLPVIEKVVGGFQNWLKANKALITEKIGHFAETVAFAFEMLWNAINRIAQFLGFKNAMDAISGALDVFRFAIVRVNVLWERFKTVMGGSREALMFVAGAVALLVGIFFFIPIAIGTAIAALFLFIDDLIAWSSGGESIIGEFLGPFEEMPAGIKNIFKIVGDALRGFGTLIEGIISGDFEMIGKSLVNIFMTPIKIAEQAIFGIINSIIRMMNDVIDEVPDVVKNRLGIKRFEEFDLNEVNDKLTFDIKKDQENAAQEKAAGSPAQKQAPPTKTSNIDVGGIAVTLPPGIQNPQEIAQLVAELVAQHIARANRQATEDSAELHGAIAP